MIQNELLLAASRSVNVRLSRGSNRRYTYKIPTIVKQETTKTPYQKGSELEEAVHLIELTILSSKPELKDCPFMIETKKIFVKNGVRHEIDVYVEIDIGHGYKSVFIFECKNWKDPVGKNDVIVFSEKIKITNSQKGYFVAEKFTKDAINQSITDERIELLKLTTDNSALLSMPDFHSIERNQSETQSNVKFIKRGAIAGEIKYEPLSPESCECMLNGNSIDLTDFLNKKSIEIIEQRLKKEPTNTLPDGIYKFEYAETYYFEPNALIVQGIDIERLDINITFPLAVSRPKVKYAFEVGKRGRAISLEGVTSKGHTLTLAFIQT